MTFTAIQRYIDVATTFYTRVSTLLQTDMDSILSELEIIDLPAGDSNPFYDLPIFGSVIQEFMTTPIVELLFTAVLFVLVIHFLKMVLDAIPFI